MNEFDDPLAEYEGEAEQHYDDFAHDYEDEFDPIYEDEFVTGFEGLSDEDAYDTFLEDYEDEDEDEFMEVEYMDDDDDDDDFDSYSANTIGRIDPNDRTLTVVVKNSTTEDKEAVIFGANEAVEPPAGLEILVEESSHREVREESKNSPFSLAGMKMSTSNPLQFDSVLRITRRSATGSKTDRVYQPRNATSPQNFSQQLIDDSAFAMDVTGQDSIRFTVKANTSIVFTFTVKARANMGNLLLGRNVAEISKAPRTTGLPQIDLLQQKKPSAFGLKPKRKKKKRVVKKVVRRSRPRPRPGRRPMPRGRRRPASRLRRR